jgi:flagellin-like hook-associated protein FlgL
VQVSSNLFGLSNIYQQNRSRLQESMTRLATGKKTSVLGSTDAAVLTMSEQFKSSISASKSSISNINLAINSLYGGDSIAESIQNVILRMEEVTARALGDPTANNLSNSQIEIAQLKKDLTILSERTYNSNPITNKEAISSFDANENKMKFWSPDGELQFEISTNFGSQTGYDTDGDFIGFDSSESYTMGKDGKFLYFIGALEDGSGYTLNQYDIINNQVQSGITALSGDTLHINESGNLYLNNNGDLDLIDTQNLTTSPTAIITNMQASSSFIVNQNVATYVDTSSDIIKYNISSASITSTIDSLGTGGGGDITYSAPTVAAYANVDSVVFGTNNFTFSASGTYAADVLQDGKIRIINTTDLVGEVVDVGTAATSATNLQFSKDGSQLFYIDGTSNSVESLTINYDYTNQTISTQDNGKVIQGTNANSLQGLSLGGSNPKTFYSFSTSSGGSPTTNNFSGVDLSVFALGLSDVSVHDLTSAQQALTSLQSAVNVVGSARVLLRTQATRLSFVETNATNMLGYTQTALQELTNVDIAAETSLTAALQVQLQGSIAILSQGKSMARNVLSLLEGI